MKIALLAVFLTISTYAFSQKADAILGIVDTHYNSLHSLQARYTERYTSMGMDRTESGTLLLKKPGRMRWSYDSPAGKLFLLDGKNGWFYTPGDAQAQRVSARQLDDLRSPLRLLLGHTQLQKELDNLSIKPSPIGFEIVGIPKGMSQRVHQLTLTVTPSGTILAMRLEELSGAMTNFTFSDQHENIPVDDIDFHFNPPSGVAVIDGLPPV